jgi:hypothetical protein
MRDAEFLIEALAVQLRELLARRGIAEPALVGYSHRRRLGRRTAAATARI